MPITVDGIDIADMVYGGTYDKNNYIKNNKNNTPYHESQDNRLIKGVPAKLIGSGIPRVVNPSPFRIVVNGSDLSLYYEAVFSEHKTSGTGTFPSWCKSYYVVSVGGGSGGNGRTGDCIHPMAYVLSSLGSDGKKGDNGKISIEHQNVQDRTYTVQIGTGGAGGEGGIDVTSYDRTWGPGPQSVAKPGFSGTNTIFKCSNYVLSSEKNANITYYRDRNEKNIKLGISFPGYGIGGTGGTVSNKDGNKGNDGYCRVCFLKNPV